MVCLALNSYKLLLENVLLRYVSINIVNEHLTGTLQSFLKMGHAMPYKTNKDLSAQVAHHLPFRAQTIFRKAFNNALEEYGTEEQAFKVAWAAVKKMYKKGQDGMWVKKTQS